MSCEKYIEEIEFHCYNCFHLNSERGDKCEKNIIGRCF